MIVFFLLLFKVEGEQSQKQVFRKWCWTNGWVPPSVILFPSPSQPPPQSSHHHLLLLQWPPFLHSIAAVTQALTLLTLILSPLCSSFPAELPSMESSKSLRISPPASLTFSPFPMMEEALLRLFALSVLSNVNYLLVFPRFEFWLINWLGACVRACGAGGPAVGDIRSRCLRLSDQSTVEALAVRNLLGHRLPLDPLQAKSEWLLPHS